MHLYRYCWQPCFQQGFWHNIYLHSWALLCSGLLEPSHTQRPTAGYYGVSPSSSLGGQKYCKNFLKPKFPIQSSLYQESSASERLVWMLEEQRQKGLPSAFPSGEEAKLEDRKQGGDDQSWILDTLANHPQIVFRVAKWLLLWKRPLPYWMLPGSWPSPSSILFSDMQR